MKVYFIIIGLIFSFFTLFGQSQKDCEQLLKKEISVNDFQENFDEFTNDFRTLIYCEFDAIDFQIFMEPQGNMPLIMKSLIELNDSSVKDNEKFTYKDLKNLIQTFKQRKEYLKARNIVEAQNKIIEKEAILQNWDVDKQLLLQMGLYDNQINDIYAIIVKNDHKKYSEIFTIYSNLLKERNKKQRIEREKRVEKLKNKYPEMVEWVKGLYAYKDFDTALQKSKKLNKPVLLYFNGYGCVNSRKIEDNILLNPDIKNIINENLIFVSLIVDERTELKENEIYFSDVLNEDVKYTGQKNLEIEIKLYKSDRQPFFVLLNSDGKEISEIGYTEDIEQFREFLKGIK